MSLTLTTAFQSLKAHIESMAADLKMNIQLGESHLKELFTKVEDLGKHVALGGRTLVTLDVGNMSVADAQSMVEDYISSLNIQATITNVVQEVEAAVKPVEADVQSGIAKAEVALGMTASTIAATTVTAVNGASNEVPAAPGV